MPALIPFWLNWSQSALDLLDKRWKSRTAQAQLQNPWQIVQVDGDALPGLCDVKEVEQKLTVQNNKKSGGDGGRPTIKGRENPEFTVEMEIHAPFQWIAWQQLKPSLNVVEKPTERDEHYVEHPLLAASGITWCIIIGLKHHKPEPGGPMKVQIKLLGCSEKKGATTVPARPPLPSAPQTTSEPQLEINVPGPDFGS